MNRNTGRTTRICIAAIAQILAEGSGSTLVQDHYERNNPWFMRELQRYVHLMGLHGFSFKLSSEGVIVTYVDPFGRKQ